MTTWSPAPADYDAVERWIRNSISDGHDALFDADAFDREVERLSKEHGFPREVIWGLGMCQVEPREDIARLTLSVPGMHVRHATQALLSFFRNCQIPHIKKTAPKVKSSMDRYLQDYLKGKSILSLARDANYPPHLLSRYLVEELTGLRGKVLTEALRRPAALLAGDEVVLERYRDSAGGGDAPERLVREVVAAQAADPLNNPRREMERHMMGVEFECVLEFQLRQLGECEGC